MKKSKDGTVQNIFMGVIALLLGIFAYVQMHGGKGAAPVAEAVAVSAAPVMPPLEKVQQAVKTAEAPAPVPSQPVKASKPAYSTSAKPVSASASAKTAAAPAAKDTKSSFPDWRENKWQNLNRFGLNE